MVQTSHWPHLRDGSPQPKSFLLLSSYQLVQTHYSVHCALHLFLVTIKIKNKKNKKRMDPQGLLVSVPQRTYAATPLARVTCVHAVAPAPSTLCCSLRLARCSSLETRPSPSSTRACAVSYNYAWEYFRRERRPGIFYHVMRATTNVK